MPEEKNNAPNDAHQMTSTVRSLLDLTGRIDERVKMITDHQAEFDAKLDRYMSTHTHLVERVVGLESRNGTRNTEEIKQLDQEMNKLKGTVHKVELALSGVRSTTNTQEYRWRMVFDFIVKIGIVIASASVKYKIGMG